MQNFDYMTPTRLIFGRGSLDKLADAIRPYGTRVLPLAESDIAAIFRASL